MTTVKAMRERHVWIAVTAVLGTSLVWLAMLSAVLLWNVYGGRYPEALVLMRAIARALLAIVRVGWPAALAALAAAGSLLVLSRRIGARRGERTSCLRAECR